MQRRLTGLGFDTKVTGVFNDDTRTVLKRWQAARGYPVTGYLNKLQHKALLTEIVSASDRTRRQLLLIVRRSSAASRQRWRGWRRRWWRRSVTVAAVVAIPPAWAASWAA